jgi:hypothetical protein
MTTTDTTPAAPKTLRPFLEVLLEVAGNPPLPDGYDTWGFKITRPDLRTFSVGGGRYRWPWPGGSVDDPATVVNGEPCPTPSTGGFCIARNLRGAAAGGYGHATILLLAYRIADVAGEGSDKLRVSHCLVADVIAGQDAYRRATGANLTGAYLADANLAGANLTGATLAGANLTGATLAGAYLTHANLTGAYLAHANLADANLTGATLAHATLRQNQLSSVQDEQYTGVPSWLS